MDLSDILTKEIKDRLVDSQFISIARQSTEPHKVSVQSDCMPKEHKWTDDQGVIAFLIQVLATIGLQVSEEMPKQTTIATVELALSAATRHFKDKHNIELKNLEAEEMLDKIEKVMAKHGNKPRN